MLRSSRRGHYQITGSNVLYIHTFGRPLITDEGRVISGAGAQPRRLALLTRLACAGQRGLTRDKLLALFWPEADEERARRGLSQAVYALRHDLGRDEVLVGSKDLRLNPDLISSDVAEFSAAVSARAWDRAVDRYGGPFLDGFHLPSAPDFERWADEQRGSFAREYCSALQQLAHEATVEGDWAAAVGWWRMLAAQDPLNATIAVELMKALVAAGDRNGALHHARVYEVLLEQELDAPPDQAVVALAEQLRQEPPAPAAAPPTHLPATPPPASRTPLEAAEVPAPAAPAPAATGPREMRRPYAVVATLLLLVSGAAIGFFLRAGSERLVPGATHRVAAGAALELDPALSPDGALLAYAADPNEEMRLYVMRTTGGRAVPITEPLAGYHRLPRWSPDGSQLAFQSGGSIYLVPALGGRPRLLVAPQPGRWVAYPAWSPDGREIVYVEDQTVYVRRLDGGPARPVARRPAAHSPAWSPDGRWIAFVSGNPIFVFGEAPGGSPVNIGNVAPSSIWVAPAGGGEPIRITDDRSLNVSPVWYPRGRRLLFVSDRDGSRDVYEVVLNRSGSPTGVPARLTTGLGAHTISLSADGRRMAYTVYAQSSNVWTMRIPPAGAAPAAEAVPVTSGNHTIEGLALSPDGRWLAFDSDRSGNQDIYRIPLAGDPTSPDHDEPVQLTSDPADDFVSSWSRDGQEIALHSYRDGVRRIRLISAEGGPLREVVASPPNQRSPGWAPDGSSLVFTSDAGDMLELYVASRTGQGSWGTARRLTPDGGWAGRWAPNGHAIVYCRPDGVWLIAPDGGAQRRLVGLEGPDLPAPELALWSPDGRTIYYKAFDARGRSSIWAVPAAGGAARLLVRFDDPSRQSNRPEFATDGERLYFTLSLRQADIWTMELSTAR